MVVHFFVNKSYRLILARFEVITAMLMYMQVSWDYVPCQLVDSYRSFEGVQCLHLQGPGVQCLWMHRHCLMMNIETLRSSARSANMYQSALRDVTEELTYIKYTMMCQSNTTNLCYVFFIVLGQHVSILIESSSGPSKNISLLKNVKMRCGIPYAYILDKTMYKMHMSLFSSCTIRISISKSLKLVIYIIANNKICM